MDHTIRYKKIIRIGDSRAITIPAYLFESQLINENDLLTITLHNLRNPETNFREVNKKCNEQDQTDT